MPKKSLVQLVAIANLPTMNYCMMKIQLCILSLSLLVCGRFSQVRYTRRTKAARVDRGGPFLAALVDCCGCVPKALGKEEGGAAHCQTNLDPQRVSSHRRTIRSIDSPTMHLALLFVEAHTRNRCRHVCSRSQSIRHMIPMIPADG